MLIHKSRLHDFLKAINKTLENWYGSNPQHAKDYGHIINDRHFDRLVSLIQNRQSGNIAIGGQHQRESRYIAPTVITDVNPFDSELMDNEIFGPILPVITYSSIDEAIGIINQK